MYRYVIKLKHDKGFCKLKVVARCIASAVYLVMSAEKCPERAIHSVKMVKEIST